MKKAVRFAADEHLEEVVALVPNLTERAEQDVAELWLSRTECETILSMATVIARESRSSFIFGKTLEHTFLSVHDDPSTTEELLSRWARHGHSQRGLECDINPTHRLHRTQSRMSCILSVLKAQDHLLNLQGDKTVTLQEKAEILSEVSSDRSARAKAFAFMIGIADAKAACQCPPAVLSLWRNAPMYEHQRSPPTRELSTGKDLSPLHRHVVRFQQGTTWPPFQAVRSVSS
jgi:hypothetical protein